MSTAVVSYAEKLKTFKSEINNPKFLAEIRQALPRHLDEETMARVVVTAATRTPKLLDCERKTVYKCIMECSQLGLMPDGLTGEAYLIPFNNNRAGRMECQIIVGYRGLLKLARNSDQISSISAHVIKAKDNCKVEFGDNERIEHTPKWNDDDAGDIIGAYAIAKFKDGGVQRAIMNLREIRAIQARSRSGRDGPWVTDFEQMALKTVIRRLAKFLPMSAELAKAMDYDGDRFADPISASVLIDEEDVVDVNATEPSKLNKLTQELNKGKATAETKVAASETKAPPAETKPAKKRATKKAAAKDEPAEQEESLEAFFAEEPESTESAEEEASQEPEIPVEEQPQEEPPADETQEPEEPDDPLAGELASEEQLAFIEAALAELNYTDQRIKGVLDYMKVARFSDLDIPGAQRIVVMLEKQVQKQRSGGI